MNSINTKTERKGPRAKLLISVFVAILLLFVLASCGSQTTQSSQQQAPSKTASTSSATAGNELQSANYGMDFEYTNRDKDASYDEASATKIVLADTGSTVDGSGASVEGAVVTIAEEGTYVVSGTLSNGSVVVNAPEDKKVQVVLNGATIHNETGAALLVEEADKVFVTLAKDSANILSDGATHDTAADESDHDGVVFSHSDITFNGEGALTVNAQYKGGIVSKDDLVITGGSYKVEAAGDALQGKDCVKIMDGNFNLVAGDDGIKSSNAEDTTRGFVSIDGGTFVIDSHNDGIQAETVLRVFGGKFDITTGEGATGNITSGQEFMGRGMMGGGQMPGEQGNNATAATTTTETDTESVKGIKAGQLVEVDGATFTINALDDSVHSNGSVSIVSGSLTLTTDDDGVHADNILNVAGGTIDIKNCNEGLEGGKIYVKGGDTSIVAVDDGLNASGDINDILLQIEGGNLYIEAAADALDSNGDFNMTGGMVNAYSTNSGVEVAIDVDSGDVTISGGTIVAGGSTWGGMAQTFTSNSSQASFVFQPSTTISAGTVVSLVDSSGKVLMTFEVEKASGSLIISCPDLKEGETYSLYAGATLDSSAVFGLENGGQLGSATKLVEFSLSQTPALVSASGQVSAITNNGGMGGMGGGAQGAPGGTPPTEGQNPQGGTPSSGGGKGQRPTSAT